MSTSIELTYVAGKNLAEMFRTHFSLSVNQDVSLLKQDIRFLSSTRHVPLAVDEVLL